LNNQRDLGYKPIVSFREEWPNTIAWFKENWLPEFFQKSNKGLTGLYKNTEKRIELQAGRQAISWTPLIAGLFVLFLVFWKWLF
jgi:hypothetical protein